MTKCVFFGYSDIGYETLNALINTGQEIVAVFTHDDNPNEEQWFRSVKQLAELNNITIYTNTPTVDDLNNITNGMACDVAVLAYYRNMLPTDWLLNRPLGSYNLHGSLLPKFRGAQPTNWAVIAGEKETGITMHKIGQQLDGGDIVGQFKVKIKSNDNAFDVMKNITPLTSKLINDYWNDIISGVVKSYPQDLSDAPIYPRRNSSDGEIDFRTNAQNIHNLVRGVSFPYPGAFFTLDEKKIIVWKTILDMDTDSGLTGSVLGQGKYPTIKCHSGAIEIVSATYENGTDATPDLKAGMTLL